MGYRSSFCALLAVLLLSSAVQAWPPFGNAWEARYPESTLSARMETQTGSSCTVCHDPSNLSAPGNCYREDIIALLDQGFSAEDAINLLDSEDSDLDGFSNGEEANRPRDGEPGEIGYNMGLVGDTGTDPCASDPSALVTGVPETPPTPSIPTVSEWGLVVMALLLVTAGKILLGQRRTAD